MRLAATFVVLIGGLLSLEAHAGSVIWLDNIEAGRAEANRTGKLLLVHFWSTHCGPCVQLDRNVYSQSEVVETIARHFVAVKINTELHPELARRHSIRFVPTDMVIDASGRLLATQKCPPHANRYLAGLMRLVPSANPAEPNQQIEQSPIVPSVPVTYQNPVSYQNAVGPRYASHTPPPHTPPAMTPAFAPGSIPPAVKRPVTPWNTPVSSQKTVRPTVEVGQLSETISSVNNQVSQSAYLPSGSTLASPARSTVEEKMTAASQAMPLPPAVESPSLDGMCPVELVEQKNWVVGNRQWGAYHRGRLYIFAGESQQQRFLANPDYYSPVLSGYDPVIAFENQKFLLGQRKHGVFFKNRIYLFANEENLKRFYQAPDRFKAAYETP